MKVYLDNSATTAPRIEVIDRMAEDMKNSYGNPSSLHRMGLDTEKMVKESRKKISEILSISPDELYFTSGGTEANNLAIQGVVERFINRKPHIITSEIEHSSVLNVFRYYRDVKNIEVDIVKVDERGIVDIEEIERLVKDNTVLVSIMLVNNEIGSIQPINEIKRKIKDKNKDVILHCDGVQAFGKMDIDLKSLGADVFTFSSHKIHAPKGVGGIYISKKINIKPLFYGGGQEKDIRPGTENTFGIFGFSHAAEIMENNKKSERKKISDIKKYTIKCLIENIDNIKINSPDGEEFLSNILNVSIPGTRGEILLHTLEQKEIYVSTGSACSSKSTAKSHVLNAIGLSPEEIEGSIRISFSYEIEKEHIDYFVKELKTAVEDLRELMSL